MGEINYPKTGFAGQLRKSEKSNKTTTTTKAVEQLIYVGSRPDRSTCTTFIGAEIESSTCEKISKIGPIGKNFAE